MQEDQADAVETPTSPEEFTELFSEETPASEGTNLPADPIEAKLAELSDEEFEESAKNPELERIPAEESDFPEFVPQDVELTEETGKPKRKAKASNKVTGTPAPIAAPPAKPEPKPEKFAPIADGLGSYKPDSATAKKGATLTKSMRTTADENAEAMLTVLESNLEIADGVSGGMAAMSMNALVQAYRSADTMETASWIVKAGAAYTIREKVRDELAKRTPGASADKLARTIDAEMAKIATTNLGAEPKTLRDYSRIYRNFFVETLGNDLEGAPVTRQDVLDACKAGLNFSIFIEADRAPNRGLALMLLKDIALAGKLSVRDARAKVDQMRAEAGIGTDKPETPEGEEGTPGATPTPSRRSLSAIEKPTSPLPGVMQAFINALVRAANDVAADKDADVEIFIYTDEEGDVVSAKTLPEITSASKDLGGVYGVQNFVSVTKKSLVLDFLIRDFS